VIADVTVVRAGRRTYRITCASMQELATATNSVAYEANRAGWPDLSPDDPPAKVRLLIVAGASLRPTRSLRQLATY
jgi:hypothetical protein